MTEQNGHVLVVDDDRRLRELLTKFLKDAGFRVQAAAMAAEARIQLAAQHFDVMVLDIMMPGETGLDFTKSLREGGNQIPILYLTARDSVEDRIEGFDSGGDDYLPKPFEPAELVSRLRAILRRVAPKKTQDIIPHLVFGDLVFHIEDGILQDKETQVFLSSTEIILLRTMAQSPRQPFSREDLAQRIGHRVTDRAVDVQITRLRKKIGDDSKQPRFIQTVRHIGYALCPDS
ncbi:response regulator [Candidatus Odyssella acanthamoebae]|uniref:Chemotaxis protein CheY n=1 Tax=Candidatus Odyssella acanthamoebae TaxID=91604 RepID=A0A077AWL2_9PROT|nr:response regulator transcription factor [Candidatus Paracaedibacter acanthamoebae]AIK96023.1 chemotaxis protein CheY [Candidatus Paracaedibacter acanthamoebae]